jgi:hypothetical protein
MREDFGDNGQPVKLKHKSLMKEIAAIQSRHEKLESGELNAKLAEKLHKKRQLRRKIRHAAKRLASKIAKGRAPRSSRISIKHIVKATTHQSARTVLSPLRTRHFERLKPLPKSTAMPQRLKPRSTKQALHTGSDSSASSSLALRNRALRMQLKDRRLELARMERRMSALHKAVHMEQQRLKTLKRRSILKNVDAVAKAIGGESRSKRKITDEKAVQQWLHERHVGEVHSRRHRAFFPKVDKRLFPTVPGVHVHHKGSQELKKSSTPAREVQLSRTEEAMFPTIDASS